MTRGLLRCHTALVAVVAASLLAGAQAQTTSYDVQVLAPPTHAEGDTLAIPVTVTVTVGGTPCPTGGTVHVTLSADANASAPGDRTPAAFWAFTPALLELAYPAGAAPVTVEGTAALVVQVVPRVTEGAEVHGTIAADVVVDDCAGLLPLGPAQVAGSAPFVATFAPANATTPGTPEQIMPPAPLPVLAVVLVALAVMAGGRRASR